MAAQTSGKTIIEEVEKEAAAVLAQRIAIEQEERKAKKRSSSKSKKKLKTQKEATVETTQKEDEEVEEPAKKRQRKQKAPVKSKSKTKQKKNKKQQEKEEGDDDEESPVKNTAAMDEHVSSNPAATAAIHEDEAGGEYIANAESDEEDEEEFELALLARAKLNLSISNNDQFNVSSDAAAYFSGVVTYLIREAVYLLRSAALSRTLSSEKAATDLRHKGIKPRTLITQREIQLLLADAEVREMLTKKIELNPLVADQLYPGLPNIVAIASKNDKDAANLLVTEVIEKSFESINSGKELAAVKKAEEEKSVPAPVSAPTKAKAGAKRKGIKA